MNTSITRLAEWQQRFVEQFVASTAQRHILVAAPGTGKTVTSIVAAYEKLKAAEGKQLVIVTDTLGLREQWHRTY